MPKHNRAARLLDRAARTPDQAAIIFEQKTITFGTLADEVRRMAAGLASIGIGQKSRVGIMIPNSPDFVVVQQALFYLGAVLSPLNIFYRTSEVLHVVQSADLDFLVMPEELQDRTLSLTAPACPSLRGIVFIEEVDRSRNAIEPATVDPEDVVLLLNTSATTGKSKAVMLTAANLEANYDRTPGWLGLDGSDTILCALPLYNTFGLNQCINACMVTGAKMVLMPRFDAEKCVRLIWKHEISFLPAVPTMLQKILNGPVGHGRLASLRTIMTGGAPVPAPLLLNLKKAAPGARVLTGYGLTEGTALVTLDEVELGADGELVRGKTIGRVLDGMDLTILGEDGRPVASGQIGEIAIRGPNLMHGYHNAPADTANAIVDGWLRSGDIGCLDEGGFAFIVDRKKDVIIRGGQNIYPADIEEVLYQLDSVSEAAVIGQPDDLLGEVPIAFVALKPGTELTANAALTHCQAELASYKVPVALYFLPDLPKGPTGKILRRGLRPPEGAQ